MKKKIVILGGGGHAKVLICVLRKLDNFCLAGYTDIVPGPEILGVKYLGDDSVLSGLRSEGVSCAAIGAGWIKDSGLRRKLFKIAEEVGFEIPPVISPDATFNTGASAGDGAQIFDGAVVNSGARLGKAAIVNTNATVEHDCRIGDFTHIAPGATLSGGASIGEDCLVGAGAVVIQCVKISSGCVLGAGAVVVRDCLSAGTYVGNPARKIK